MEDQIVWLIGVLVTVGLSFLGIGVAAFRNLSNKTSEGDRVLHRRIEAVKDNYVRRDDLDGHLDRIGASVSDLKSEMKEMKENIEAKHSQILEAVMERNSSRHSRHDD